MRAFGIVLTCGVVATGILSVGSISGGQAPLAPHAVDPAFAERIKTFSEPGGSFDTDNLISNEVSYLEVVPGLIERAVTGGVYLGVGPDQNFSYIARIRPSVAYIVDIRRDNLLLHLLFKALFAESPTRFEYLCGLIGRAPPAPDVSWQAAPLETLLERLGHAPPAEPSVLRRRIDARIASFGVPLAPAELDTIARFHQAFIGAGMGLRFQSHGRPPQWYYPTLRHLILATDRDRRQWSFLADEPAYRFVRELQATDRVIPIVGDISGPHALRTLGQALAADGLKVSAFYVSNVENYLFRSGRFEAYAENLSGLPHAPNAVIIRSVFRGGPSASTAQRIDTLLEGVASKRIHNYMDVLTDRRP